VHGHADVFRLQEVEAVARHPLNLRNFPYEHLSWSEVDPGCETAGAVF
jgi:hypothetical protein